MQLNSLTLSTKLSLATAQDLTLKLNSLNITSPGTLDLSDNALIYDYTGASPIGTIGGWIASGYAGGAWNGNGISSSTAATTANRGLGYAEATDLLGTFPATFAGQNIDNTSVLVRYTLAGDATLDQKVDVSDLGRLSTYWNQSSRRWSQGDFNYDGRADVADLGLLSTNWQKSVGIPPAAPEVMTSAIDELTAASEI
jgi:hypothetical protein